MKRTRGAMDSFEQFLRPQGKGSSDTLAGMTSLAAFPGGESKTSDTDPPPPEGKQAAMTSNPSVD